MCPSTGCSDRRKRKPWNRTRQSAASSLDQVHEIRFLFKDNLYNDLLHHNKMITRYRPNRKYERNDQFARFKQSQCQHQLNQNALFQNPS